MDRNTSRPRQRIRATANAARAANVVASAAEPTVRMALFFIHVKNAPPRTASLKLPPSSGQGKPYRSFRYWSWPLNAVDSMNQTG